MSSRAKWAIWGALFGLGFPVLAGTLRVAEHGVAGGLALMQTDPLLWIICTAPLFLGAFAFLGGRQHDQVRAFSQNLETLVTARTAELQRATEDLAQQFRAHETLLDALSEGIVTFDRSGQLSAEQSPALRRLVPGADSARTLEALMHQGFGVASETTQLVLECIWDKSFDSPFEETCAMLGRTVTRKEQGVEQTLALTFKKLGPDCEDPEAVLLVVTDVTAQARQRHAEAEQAERMERVGIAAQDPSAFLFSAEELRALCARLQARTDRRDLHTLKGSAAVVGFKSLATRVHELESALEDGTPDEEIRAGLATVEAELEAQVRDVMSVLQIEGQRDALPVSKARLEAVFRISRRLGDRELMESLTRLTRMPLRRALSREIRRTEQIAARRGLDVLWNADGASELSGSETQALHGAVVHIFANAVEHGGRGVKRPLTIGLRVERIEQVITLEVTDDGLGIDTEALVNKAIESGWATPDETLRWSEREKLDLIFRDELSTAQAVSDASGRGQGMGAARLALQRLGGNLDVRSAWGRGTLCRLTIRSSLGASLYPPLESLLPENEQDRASA